MHILMIILVLCNALILTAVSIPTIHAYYPAQHHIFTIKPVMYARDAQHNAHPV